MGFRAIILFLASLLVVNTSGRSLFPLPFTNADQKPIQPPSHSTGIDIPSIGLGLWNSHSESATHAVTSAFSTGYHHIDSAAAYANEEYVGAGLQNLTLPRHKYWITSKLWNTAHRPHLVPLALNKTLSDLQTPYLDLYLMHWPVAFEPNHPSRTIIDQDVSILDTWRAMEDLVRTNQTRFIGVSNFSPRQLDLVLSKCTICPFAHEFETHPYLQQQEFVDWHADHDMRVIAYSPLANLNPTYNGTHPEVGGPILDDPFWRELARNKSATVAQTVLAWGIQRGAIVIPKSVHKTRIEENWGARKVAEFTKEEMLRVREQDRRARFNNPGKSWGVELFEGLDDGTNRFLVEGPRPEEAVVEVS